MVARWRCGRGWEILVVSLVFLGLTGCATPRRIDWNNRVGTYSFDQAVLDYGPPDKSAILADGVKVCEWLRQRGAAYGSLQTMPGFWSQSYYETRSPDHYLRLTFDAGGRLREWRNVAR